MIITTLIALICIYAGYKTFKQLSHDQKVNLLIFIYSFILFASGVAIAIILIV